MQQAFSDYVLKHIPTIRIRISKKKDSLSEQTGLKVHQVSTWFPNARRRKPNPVGDGPLTSSCHNSLAEHRDITHEQPPAVSPLDRWRVHTNDMHIGVLLLQASG
ncbi:hypothetical protein P170DRAFT_212830 [Aspergillus steynii IBT 23096]|uniref:Homeobox domain-containing protein n=1 Tax=Aspergillus steynii IBT 23096 TaxID=1392250 RepID=A0A2I2G6M6_9EURO|nr:uncharacterized protein P170DRAFT_212830 [Aspergillus steynii IBT 23096]PLB48525.1 hypothetical protein P170DRAFT_212830 [Aspergillus steynii IBT 23096]